MLTKKNFSFYINQTILSVSLNISYYATGKSKQSVITLNMSYYQNIPQQK